MKNFTIQKQAMLVKAKETKHDVPKLGNKITVPKWDDSLRVYAAQVYGAREATLEYLLRPDTAVLMPHPPLLADCPHSAVGSIQGELSLRLSHTHPLYRDDNK